MRGAAATQGVIDGFVVIGGLTALALALVVAHRPAPIGPASHLPLFAGRAGAKPAQPRWEFPNQSLPRARLHQARVGEQAALAAFDGAVLQALKETEQALSAYSTELEHHQDLLLAQTKARRAYDLAHGQFLAGATSQLDLLSAEQAFVSAEAAVAGSDGALVQDQIAVFKALGGGWAGAGRP